MIVVERMALADAAEQLALQRKAFLPLYARYRDEGSPIFTPEFEMIRRIEDPCGVSLKILVDGIAAGGLYATTLRPDTSEMCMSAIYVDPDFQGRGLAQMILEQLEKERPDIRHWWLKVPKEEAVNRHIYEKMGYQNTGRESVINDRLTLLFYEKHT